MDTSKTQYIGIDIKKRSDTIYRYMPVERLLQLVVNKKNTLVSPSKWDDPFENMLSRIQFTRPNAKVHLYSLRDRVFGQCWTSSEESDAHWRIYTPNKDGVRIRTTISKLFNSMCCKTEFYHMSWFIGKVRYLKEVELLDFFSDGTWIDEIKNNGSQGQALSLLFKREEFKHESEIRVIYLEPRNINSEKVFHYDFVPENLIQEITFDPRIDDYVYNTYKTILCNHGCDDVAINKSTLYQTPLLEIPFKTNY